MSIRNWILDNVIGYDETKFNETAQWFSKKRPPYWWITMTLATYPFLMDTEDVWSDIYLWISLTNWLVFWILIFIFHINNTKKRKQ